MKVVPFPVLSPSLARFDQSFIVSPLSWGPKELHLGHMGLRFSCCQLSHPLCSQGCSPGTAPASPAASASCLQPAQLSPDLFTLSPHLINAHCLTSFSLVIPNCMLLSQLNPNQYTFCISQGFPGKWDKYVDIL